MQCNIQLQFNCCLVLAVCNIQLLLSACNMQYSTAAQCTPCPPPSPSPGCGLTEPAGRLIMRATAAANKLQLLPSLMYLKCSNPHIVLLCHYTEDCYGRRCWLKGFQTFVYGTTVHSMHQCLQGLHPHLLPCPPTASQAAAPVSAPAAAAAA